MTGPGTVRSDPVEVAELWNRHAGDPELLAEDVAGLWPDGPEPGATGGPVELFGVGDSGGSRLGAAALSLPAQRGAAAHLQLLVVDAAHRGRGLGTELVHAAESRARRAGASSLVVGAGAPFYLLTGVDSRWTPALSLFESLGYARVAVELDLVCGTRPPRHDPPQGVRAEGVRDEAAAAAVLAMARTHHPHWVDEFARAARAGTVQVVRRGDGSVAAAAAHSVTRLGVVGPVAVDPTEQGRGLGGLVVRGALAELAAAGVDRAEIAWTSTVGFYARCCGAAVGRTSVVLARDLATAGPGTVAP